MELKYFDLHKTFCLLTAPAVFSPLCRLRVQSAQEVCIPSLCFSPKIYDLPPKEKYLLKLNYFEQLHLGKKIAKKIELGIDFLMEGKEY